MVKRLILAAGHGGGDSGAVGQGTTEAATCIDIVNRTAELIRADGRFEVVVVPHELGLADSIRWVNARYKNLEDGYALEVHKNAFVGAHGVEVWFYGGDSISQQYAQHIQNGLVELTGLPNRGVKPDTSNRHGSLGWIRETNPWAGLAECGFITDGGDPLDPGMYALGIYLGAMKLFGLAPKPVVAPAPPVPAPKPDVAYRVFANGKQIGAYKEEKNAWEKYVTAGGTAILDVLGNDVTATMVLKYRPQVPQPAPDAEPHPELEDIKSRLTAIETFINYLKGIFK